MKNNLISPLYGTSAIIREHYKGYNGKVDGPKTFKKRKPKKIKLNDPKSVTSHYHRTELFLQNKDINTWCYSLGMRRHDIETPPRLSDVAFLLEFRREFEKEYKQDKSCYAIYNAYWGIVYKQHRILKRKAFIKFEKIALKCLEIRQLNQNNINKITSLRGSANNNNIGHNNEAKGPCLPRVTNTKRDEQECRVVPKGCVNHKVCDAHEFWY